MGAPTPSLCQLLGVHATDTAPACPAVAGPGRAALPGLCLLAVLQRPRLHQCDGVHGQHSAALEAGARCGKAWHFFHPARGHPAIMLPAGRPMQCDYKHTTAGHGDSAVCSSVGVEFCGNARIRAHVLLMVPSFPLRAFAAAGGAVPFCNLHRCPASLCPLCSIWAPSSRGRAGLVTAAPQQCACTTSGTGRRSLIGRLTSCLGPRPPGGWGHAAALPGVPAGVLVHGLSLKSLTNAHFLLAIGQDTCCSKCCPCRLSAVVHASWHTQVCLTPVGSSLGAAL